MWWYNWEQRNTKWKMSCSSQINYWVRKITFYHFLYTKSTCNSLLKNLFTCTSVLGYFGKQCKGDDVQSFMQKYAVNITKCMQNDSQYIFAYFTLFFSFRKCPFHSIRQYIYLKRKTQVCYTQWICIVHMCWRTSLHRRRLYAMHAFIAPPLKHHLGELMNSNQRKNPKDSFKKNL